MEALEKSHNGFKAYDIRGIVPTEVDEEVSYRVGRAYADQYKARKVAVGRDIRESSPRLAEAVARGLTDGGADVYD
ncbi:MAG: phosphomannomutase, partial [Negativicoccus succinicivorans]|nr:phosphomannomutase [Negativicoccus succinicivorans]